MALHSRDNLIKQFKKHLQTWNENSFKTFGPMDTKHIQMASVDEMMAAYGYVPRRLPDYPNVIDGRFGYVLAFPSSDLPTYMSLEDAVSMHNGNGNPLHQPNDRIFFALRNKIVDQVGIQRDKSTGRTRIKSQKVWIRFCDHDESEEYFGIPFDDGLLNKEGK